jgi:hypothetical protein
VLLDFISQKLEAFLSNDTDGYEYKLMASSCAIVMTVLVISTTVIGEHDFSTPLIKKTPFDTILSQLHPRTVLTTSLCKRDINNILQFSE